MFVGTAATPPMNQISHYGEAETIKIKCHYELIRLGITSFSELLFLTTAARKGRVFNLGELIPEQTDHIVFGGKQIKCVLKTLFTHSHLPLPR